MGDFSAATPEILLPGDRLYFEISRHMDEVLNEYDRIGGQRTLHELIAQIDPPPVVAVLRALMGIADDIEPPADQPTRGNKGHEVHVGGSNGLPHPRAKWKQIERDGCPLPNGNYICARVFPTAEERNYTDPYQRDESAKVRVYKVERGVEMCLGVKNFMDQEITVEPFFVDTAEKEASEGPQVLSPLGQSQLKLKSELGDGEIRDGWRLKDVSGEVIVTVYLEVQA